MIYTVLLLADLLLCVGLIVRLEAARKVIIWLQGLSIIIVVASIFLLVGIQHQIQQLKISKDATYNKISQMNLTADQKLQLDEINAELDEKEKQAGHAVVFSYAKLGITAFHLRSDSGVFDTSQSSRSLPYPRGLEIFAIAPL